MRKRRSKNHQCQNCCFRFHTDTLHDNFCPNCGQENHNPRLPLRGYFKDLVENVFHLDGKTGLALRVLVLKPGTITKDFIENRRARYSPPIRLFIFSLLMFIICFELAQSIMSKKDSHNNETTALDEMIKTEVDTSYIKFANPYFNGGKVKYTIEELNRIDTLQRSEIGAWLVSEGLPSDFMFRTQVELIQYTLKKHKSMEEFQLEYVTRTNYWLIFLMVPVSAFFIYFFFYRKGIMFYDTMILSIHLTVFSLLLGIVLTILVIPMIKYFELQETTVMLFLILILGLLFNCLPAYKKIFQRSWVSTVARALLINGCVFVSYVVLFSVMLWIRMRLHVL